MRKLSKFDIALMVGIFIIVIGIFSLVFVINSKSGQCVANPCKFIEENKLTDEQATCVVYVDKQTGQQIFDFSSLESYNNSLKTKNP